ncbi:Flp pilus assembly complex ATPase component TadA [Candidatus Woesearchaeota archaeon]|nr:Flp pilus assembly complex ATPase component TadA [Candidatus Woesearchaeota archaeon]
MKRIQTEKERKEDNKDNMNKNDMNKDNYENNEEEIEKLVPDSSVIVDGLLSKKIEKKEILPREIIIHEALLQKFEEQAGKNNAVGTIGIEEIAELNKLGRELNITIRFSGQKLRQNELEHCSLDNINIMIKELAYAEDATLMTTKETVAKSAQAKNLKLIFIEPFTKGKKIRLEKYFDDTTMSVHLREGVCPTAKKGVPGNWSFETVDPKLLTQKDVQLISREIIEEANLRKDGFIEIERPGSTIIQLGLFRIVITKPPFSDGWEITAVRPVAHLKLEDYKLSERLMERITKQAEGILIAGAPGMGKSTFAAALAEFYASQNKIVKTVEAPRDLVLPETITQYAISYGNSQEIHDILLLSRPDHTFFDEMRNTDDFRLFADLRLAGIGFIGVVHATNPIDAIQRFIGRIELGVIPQVVDTVMFIKNGQINKVLSLQMVVKVPSGMNEADLARPIVVVNDFETKRLEYEIYSYGEETVVIPVRADAKQSPVKDLAAKHVLSVLKRFTHNAKVEILSDNKAIAYVPNEEIAYIIGKQGKNISEIEKQAGISIDVKPLTAAKQAEEKENPNGQNLNESAGQGKGQAIEYNVMINRNSIVFDVDQEYIGKDVSIVVNGSMLMIAKVGKKARVKVRKDNAMGKLMVDAVNMGEKIELKVG